MGTSFKRYLVNLARVLVVTCLISAFNLPAAHAAPLDGANWLAAQQNADGSINTPASLATAFQSTAEALLARQALKLNTQPDFTAALAWLNTSPENHTEYLARKIIINSQAGNNVTAWVDELLTRQNRDAVRQDADGGFGDEAGDSSSVLNTAFTLEALAAAKQPVGTPLNAAVGYLLAQQQANGSWKDGNNTASIYLTALSLRALWHYRHEYAAVPAALDKARDYLLANRDAAGLWSETFITALALNALIPYLPDFSLITNSLASLGAGQSANGSWNDDAYTTALALRAMALAKQPQANPDYATIQGKVIDAQTGLPLSGVTVLLTGATNASVVTQGDGGFVFRKLAAGSYALQMSLQNYGALSTTTIVRVGQTLDLGMLSLTKSLGATTGTIKGIATDFDTGLPLADVSISTGLALPVLTDANGAYQISNVAAGYVTISANKVGYVVVTGSAYLATGGTMVFSPALTAGITQDTVMRGTVTDGVTGLPLAGASINITGASVASALTDTQGNYYIAGLNPRTSTVTVTLSGYDTLITNVTIVQNSMVRFSPQLYPTGTTPANSNSSGIAGVVVDAGSGLPLGGVSVTASFGVTLTTQKTDAEGRFAFAGFINTQGTLYVSLPGYDTANVAATLEPLRTLNIGTVRLRKAKITVFLPDLIVTDIISTSAPTDPNSLIVSGSITSNITNIGTANAPTNIQVAAFYDANQNGILDQADVILGQVATTSDLQVGATAMMAIPVHGGLPFRDAPISVMVDASQSLVELDETNNIDVTASQCHAKSTVPITVPDGYFVDVFARKVTNQQGPVGFAFDSKDNLYIATGSGSTILKIPSGTNVPVSFGSGHGDPDGVAVDSNDNVYVADTVIKKYTPSGELIWQHQALPYMNTQAAAVDADDNLYVGSIDSRILKFSSDGSSLIVLAGYNGPSEPAVSSDGFLYVGQFSGYRNNIIKSTLEGQFHEVIADQQGAVQPTFDSLGNLYFGSDTVLKKVSFPDKKVSNFATGFQFVRAIGFDKTGNLYVGDGTTKDIYKIALSGQPDLTASLLRLVDNGTSQPMSLTLRVGNAGASPSSAGITTAFYQGDPATGGVLLGNVLMPAMAVGTYQDIRLDNVVLSGNADIYAVVDSISALSECNEGNNTVHIPLSAALRLGTVTVVTDQPVYAPNSTMLITASVANTGTLPADYRVDLQIEDGQGGIVTTLPAQAAGPLDGGASAAVAFNWNVGATLSGSYTVRVILRDVDGNILNEATTGFNLGHPDSAGPLVSLRVSTDRPVYYTHDLVNIDSLVGNLSLGTLIDQASLRLTIIDANGQAVFTTSTAMGQLLPNTLRILNLPYTLNGAAIAVYQVKGDVLDTSQSVLASAQATFEVRFDLAKALTGQVTASLATLDAGTTQTCTDTLTNRGAASAAVEVHHALLNIDSQQLVADQSLSISLDAGQSDTHTRSLATGHLATGNYACALMVRLGNELRTIAYAAFYVKQLPIKLSTDLNLGGKGRLLVLLDNNRHGEENDKHTAACTGVTRLGLAATLPVALSPAAVVEARVYRDNVLIDSESANLASFAGAVNASSGGSGGDLSLSLLTDHSVTLTLVPGAGTTALAGDYIVETVITDGNTLALRSDTLRTDCGHALVVGETHQAFTLSVVDRLPAANDGKVNDSDPHGTKSAPALSAQRAFLEQLLTAAGWSYTITDTAEDFTRAFHSGGYIAYALLAEKEKLAEQTQKELREAVHRGEGLVVAGAHDSSNLHSERLRDALGIKPIGSVSHANGIDLTASALALSGHLALIPDDRALRIQRVTADSAGVYTPGAAMGNTAHDASDCHDDEVQDKDHDACEGHPEAYLDAIALNAYGLGRTGFVGFDLLATATRDGQGSLAANTLRALLDHVTPAVLATGPGAVVPLALTLRNEGVAVTLNATLPLPAGMQVMDPGTGTLTGTTVTWSLTLAAGEEKTLTLWVRLPDLDGPVTLSANVIASAGSAQLAYNPTLTVIVAQPPTLGNQKAALDALIKANHPDKKALTKASNALDQALKNITPAPAIKDLLKATDALLGLTDPAVVNIRIGLDTWLHWAAQYAYY